VQRISVVGSSCSGKTTLARALAERLGLPYIELDALHHGPNWNEAPAELLQERVRAALASAPRGWVVDGSYHGKLGDLVFAQADTAVLLHPRYATVLWRSLHRTVRRLITGEELWNRNRERLRNVFSRNSIPLYVLRTHPGRRARFLGLFERHPQLEVIELGGRRDVERWLQSIQPTAEMSGSSGSSERQNTPPLTDR
jgi:adenylate kinase family enzyme